MSKRGVNPALADIERELADLERRREEMDRAIARLQRVAGWLRRRARDGRISASERQRFDSTPHRRPSLTAYCRAALRMNAPRGLTPREVRDFLATAGFDWSVYSNGQAALHTVLKRLVHQQEVTVTVDPEGDTRYAIRQVRAVALTRTDLEDEAFLKNILVADTPETVEAVVRAHRQKQRLR
jgi:hypothetical protein